MIWQLILSLFLYSILRKVILINYFYLFDFLYYFLYFILLLVLTILSIFQIYAFLLIDFKFSTLFFVIILKVDLIHFHELLLVLVLFSFASLSSSFLTLYVFLKFIQINFLIADTLHLFHSNVFQLFLYFYYANLDRLFSFITNLLCNLFIINLVLINRFDFAFITNIN